MHRLALQERPVAAAHLLAAARTSSRHVLAWLRKPFCGGPHWLHQDRLRFTSFRSACGLVGGSACAVEAPPSSQTYYLLPLTTYYYQLLLLTTYYYY
jgi:hypothetical protein